MSTIRLLEPPEDLLVTKAHLLVKSGHHSTVGPVRWAHHLKKLATIKWYAPFVCPEGVRLVMVP